MAIQGTPEQAGPGGSIRTVLGTSSVPDAWQAADTYNPIIGYERQPRLRVFQPPVAPERGVGLVLERDGGSLVELMPGQGATSLGLVSDVRMVYRIDVRDHPLGLRFRLPCANDPHEFIADVQLVAAVCRPAVIVEHWLTDVRRNLGPLLDELLCEVSGRFHVEQRELAERSLRRELHEGAPRIGLDAGLRVDGVTLRVRVDEATEDHLAARAKLERSIDRSRLLADIPDLGSLSLIALELDRNPGDVREVIGQVARQREAEIEIRKKAIQFLIDNDIVEAAQFAEAARNGVVSREILDALELVRGRVGGLDHNGDERLQHRQSPAIKTVYSGETNDA